ncbi:MAG: tetratricopeptide repeat protein [Anaerolineae bacterium]|nr:tetratricopeptide repeat protein [Anaerolineae bacterium]
MKLFISFSPTDTPRVEEIAAQLRAANHDAWTDHPAVPIDDKRALRHQIESCDAFIALISPAYLAAVEGKREYRTAKKERMELIALLIDPQAAAQIPSDLRQAALLDFTAGATAENTAALLESLTRLEADLSSRRARSTTARPQPAEPEESADDTDSIALQLLEITGAETEPVHALKQSINTALEAGDWDTAVSHLNELIAADPIAAHYVVRGNTHVELGKKQKALADYTEAIRLDPTVAAVFNNRGQLYKQLKKFNEALADYTLAIGLDAKSADAYLNRGSLYDELGKRDEALADYDHAAQRDPQQVQIFYNRGFLYFQLNNLEAALKDFETACQLIPDDELNHNNRAFILFQLARYEEAEAAWQQATNQPDVDSFIYAGHAVALEQLGRGEEAVAQYHRAVELDRRWKNKLTSIADEFVWTPAMQKLAQSIVRRLRARS